MILRFTLRSAAYPTKALNKFYEWANDLDLKLSLEKCTVFHMGYLNQRYNYTLGGIALQKTSLVRDLES